MKISIIGTGSVAIALAGAWAQSGHSVTLGSRHPQSGIEHLAHPVASLADAVASADVVVNATPGSASLSILSALSAELFDGKVLLDVANAHTPDYELVYPQSSLGQALQDALPNARVVKSLNTADMSVIVDPDSIGESSVFVSGDDEDAKRTVAGLIADLGWNPSAIVDLGGIATAKATEHYLFLFLALRLASGGPHFNIRLVRPTL